MFDGSSIFIFGYSVILFFADLGYIKGPISRMKSSILLLNARSGPFGPVGAYTHPMPAYARASQAGVKGGVTTSATQAL